MGALFDLPEDIFLNIVSHLPVQTVGQCRCVCKSWRGLLSWRKFIKAHLNRSRNVLEQSLIFTAFEGGQGYLFYAPLKSAHQVFDEITISAKNLNIADYPVSWDQVHSSCDGLVLTEAFPGKKFVLNPITRVVIEVPSSPFAIDCDDDVTVYVLGYDSVGDDYKVVSVSFEFDDKVIEKGVDFTKTFVNVYSLKTDLWKRVESPFYWHFDAPLSSGAFVNGCIHWVGCNAPDFESAIVAFDVATEKFHKVPPPSSVGNNVVSHHVAVLDGHLCISHPYGTDIWMMKQSSWTRFTVGNLDGYDFRPLCMLGQEEVVFWKNYQELVVSNFKEGTLKDIVVQGIPKNHQPGASFVESLISPHSSSVTGGE